MTNTPSTPAAWYAENYPGCSPQYIAAEHGGPRTQKGGDHAPVIVLNPGGVRTATGCTCGARPKTPPQSSRSMSTAYMAHIRALGLPRIHNFSHSVYAYGEGYPAEGLTWNEWRALHPNKDPFGQRD